jgi:hypothetical protein
MPSVFPSKRNRGPELPDTLSARLLHYAAVPLVKNAGMRFSQPVFGDHQRAHLIAGPEFQFDNAAGGFNFDMDPCALLWLHVRNTLVSLFIRYSKIKIARAISRVKILDVVVYLIDIEQTGMASAIPGGPFGYGRFIKNTGFRIR